MRIIIVDDELNARLALAGILADSFPEVEVLSLCKDIPEAIKAIHKHQPDLVFLDISMPGYSGLELFDFFEDDQINFRVVFVTAHAEFALNAFGLNALDYLLKPIKIVEVERALKKMSSQKESLKIVKNKISSHLSQQEKIALQTGEGLLFLEIENIIYLKADGSYTHFFTTDNKKITISKRLAEFEKLENMGKFMRIHRSHLVNINQIEKLLKQDGGTLIMTNGAELSISNDKKQLLMDMFLDNKL
jgi:two-component system, LytTR family, response regulator